MSVPSTSDMVKHIVSSDLLKHIVLSDKFDMSSFNNHHEFLSFMLSNPDTKKEFLKLVANILTEVIGDRLESIDLNGCCVSSDTK